MSSIASEGGKQERGGLTQERRSHESKILCPYMKGIIKMYWKYPEMYVRGV